MLKLALRNIFRHKMRTAMTLAAIVFGVVGLILSGGFVQDIFVQVGEFTIRAQSGHLQVAKSGFFTHGSRFPDKYLVPKPDAVKAAIVRLPEVDDVMARLDFSGLLNNGRSDIDIIGQGVEPYKEARLGTYLRIIAGLPLRSRDVYGILVGEGLAGAMKLKPGDTVTLLVVTAEGAMNSLDFDVVGIFQSFSKDFDARAVRVHLPAAQQLMNSQGVNKLVVSLKRTDDTAAVAAALEPQLRALDLEVQTWQQLNDFYRKTVDLYEHQFGVLQLIILVMVLLSVANSVNMSLFERLGEFGTLMALGNRRGQVFNLIFIESALLGLSGGLAGAALGALLAWAISLVGIPMPPPPNADIGYTARIQVTLPLLVAGFTVGFLATTAACLWPARRVSCTPVVDALRSNA